MAETLADLRKRLAEEEKALKAKYLEKFEQAKKREGRVNALEAKRLRKQENHIKTLLGGFMLAQMKKSKKVDALETLLKETTREQDIKSLKALIDSLGK
jgi:citrate lyase beta subunit